MSTVHKKGRFKGIDKPQTFCGLDILSMENYDERTAFRWNSVTCSNCLKQSPEAIAARSA